MTEELLKKLILQDGDTLIREDHRTKGPLGETEIDTYAVLNVSGEKVGTVVHTEHTAIKGFARTQTIEQVDLDGKSLRSARW